MIYTKSPLAAKNIVPAAREDIIIGTLIFETDLFANSTEYIKRMKVTSPKI
ncbi:hypothetical protein JCM21531_1515 [Acetivibrio straminisolvens JCM 21531]|uniref:Uncharacterized protein n=1 Tax=Acetivibrio straminisolvens JCM 21531 TaxID=1294263 RepID=W4V4M0_9FIRM|nr:hypothetical protein JCM21531_1515 [Acetivibrio straminisolvens JCM 21531]